MYEIRVTQDPKTGRDIARMVVGAETLEAASRSGATMALARMVMLTDSPDGPYEVRNSKGRVCYTGPSLFELGFLRVREDDRGYGFERYTAPIAFRNAPL